jgi:hypothetical protein
MKIQAFARLVPTAEANAAAVGGTKGAFTPGGKHAFAGTTARRVGSASGSPIAKHLLPNVAL